MTLFQATQSMSRGEQEEEGRWVALVANTGCKVKMKQDAKQDDSSWYFMALG